MCARPPINLIFLSHHHRGAGWIDFEKGGRKGEVGVSILKNKTLGSLAPQTKAVHKKKKRKKGKWNEMQSGSFA